MSQTLAQRRALAARSQERAERPDRDHERAERPDRDTAPARAHATGPRQDARAPPGPAADSGAFRPDSGAAGRAILTLVRGGARVVDVGPGRVLLRRGACDCEVDRAGRVAWHRR